MTTDITEEILISPPFIKLEQLLKLSGVAQTGGHAKILIIEGLVKVNGEVCTQRGKKIQGGDRVSFEETTILVKEKGV